MEPSNSQRLSLIAAQGPHTFTSDEPPHDFACRIESFKRLSNIISESGAETYETSSFKKGGYRWKLMMYPNGDKKNGGEGYISIYLVLVDSHSFPVELKVYATLSFFIYNPTQLHYLVFQGHRDQEYQYNSSGYGWHKFDKLKNGYGYPKMMPLTTFHDPASGYLIDDSCVVGVNVNVKRVLSFKMKAKLERLCNSGGSVIRTSFKFSQFDNEYYETEGFTAGGQEWVLRLYPGWINDYGKHLSLYLRLSRPKSLVGRVLRYFQQNVHQKVHAKFTLRVVDQLHGKHVERTVCGVYSDSNLSLGCGDFMELCQLRDQSHGYIQNDNLIAEVDFSDIIAN